MTTVDSCGISTTDRRPPPDERRKAVLFCPHCGFESGADENWVATSAGSGLELACPDCENVVAVR